MSQLVLSIFPGIDLLGRGFEDLGFCVVRGPDEIFGGDIRGFHPPKGKFDGIIGGPPCQDFSTARRPNNPPTGDGLAMLEEYRRVVLEAAPRWWLLENVPRCPNVLIDGYSHQRIDLDGRDVGMRQCRLRHFQFGNNAGLVLELERPTSRKQLGAMAAAITATEGTKAQERRQWEEFCALQGLPAGFDLPLFSLFGRYRAVGQSVPLPMARALAHAILHPSLRTVCACGCARPVHGDATYAGASCRKRAQRSRDGARPGAGGDRSVTVTGLAPFPSEKSRLPP